jgi:hypothetical protein
MLLLALLVLLTVCAAEVVPACNQIEAVTQTTSDVSRSGGINNPPPGGGWGGQRRKN